MKPCHETIWCCYLCWKGRNRAQSFVLMFTLQYVEYLNRNVSIGQLFQHISKSIVVCARSRPKMLTEKNIRKKFVRLHITIAFYQLWLQILCYLTTKT